MSQEEKISAPPACSTPPEFVGACNDALALFGFSARPALAADEAFLTSLAVERLAPQFAGSGLDPETLDTLLIMQARAQAASYAAAFPHASHALLLDESRGPAGRLLVNRTPSDLRLVDIVLHPRVRGRGLGTALLRALQAHAALRGLPLRLSVLPDNPALRLYSRLGFVVIGESGVRIEMEWTHSSHQIPAG